LRPPSGVVCASSCRPWHPPRHPGWQHRAMLPCYCPGSVEVGPPWCWRSDGCRRHTILWRWSWEYRSTHGEVPIVSHHARDFWSSLPRSHWGPCRTSSIHWARRGMSSTRTIQAPRLPDDPAGVPRVHRVGLAAAAKLWERSRSAVVDSSLSQMASHRARASQSWPKPG
jgi:hypothetical protein